MSDYVVAVVKLRRAGQLGGIRRRVPMAENEIANRVAKTLGALPRQNLPLVRISGARQYSRGPT